MTLDERILVAQALCMGLQITGFMGHDTMIAPKEHPAYVMGAIRASQGSSKIRSLTDDEDARMKYIIAVEADWVD